RDRLVRKVEARRTSVDDHAQGAPVGLTEGRDDESLSEAVPGHGWRRVPCVRVLTSRVYPSLLEGRHGMQRSPRDDVAGGSRPRVVVLVLVADRALERAVPREAGTRRGEAVPASAGLLLAGLDTALLGTSQKRAVEADRRRRRAAKAGLSARVPSVDPTLAQAGLELGAAVDLLASRGRAPARADVRGRLEAADVDVGRARVRTIEADLLARLRVAGDQLVLR